jgi:hypothetical protein
MGAVRNVAGPILASAAVAIGGWGIEQAHEGLAGYCVDVQCSSPEPLFKTLCNYLNSLGRIAQILVL